MNRTLVERRALVTGIAKDGQGVQLLQYLPANYDLVDINIDEPTGRFEALITGEDSAGWTLADYVIPRLQSGGYGATEVPSTVRLTMESDYTRYRDLPGSPWREDHQLGRGRTARVTLPAVLQDEACPYCGGYGADYRAEQREFLDGTLSAVALTCDDCNGTFAEVQR